MKKKVLMCYHSAEYGGVEQQILDIIRGLSKEIDFYVACPNGPLVKKYMSAGAIEHINLCPHSEIDLMYALKISSIVKKNKIDVVHAHELKTGVLATVGAYLGGADKRIYHVHTSFREWSHSSIKKYPALFVNFLANIVTGNFLATYVLAL